MNDAGIALVKEFEGFRAKAYKCPADVWTVGYGLTSAAGIGVEVVPGMVVTEAEATEHLRLVLDKFGASIRPKMTAEPNENEWAAMLSLAFNIGPSAFAKSTVLRKFNAGDKAGAADAFLLWNKAGGKVLAGLKRRREAERALFLKPVSVKKDRANVTQSTTVRASAVQLASGVGSGVVAVGALDGTAQIVAIVLAAVIVLAAAWVFKERLRHWADGVR